MPALAKHLLELRALGAAVPDVCEDPRHDPVGVDADLLRVAGPLRFKDGVLLLAAGDPAVGGNAELRGRAGFCHVRSLLFMICPFFNFRLTSPVGKIRMAEVI